MNTILDTLSQFHLFYLLDILIFEYVFLYNIVPKN